MKDFVRFLSGKTFNPVAVPDEFTEEAFILTTKDYQYHFPEISGNTIQEAIIHNGEGLPVFMFRLGSLVTSSEFEQKNEVVHMLHWLMKEVCSCEIYFNNKIGTGLLVVHGEGMVIGSRNTIGDGFVIHQGCTIGHRKNGMGKPSGQGCIIGNNVRMYVNSTLIGEIEIGDNVVIGAHTLVKENIPSDTIIINKLVQEIIRKEI